MDKRIDLPAAQAYDKEHDVFGKLCEAFEQRGGGSGHDLGLTGALAIIAQWEKMRTQENVDALKMLSEATPSELDAKEKGEHVQSRRPGSTGLSM